MDIQEIMQVLTLLAIVLAFYWSHRSFPPDKTAELIRELTEIATKTDSRLDDAIVEIMDYVNEARRLNNDGDDTETELQ